MARGRNVAWLAKAVTPETAARGSVLVVGAPRAWSWSVVEAVEDGFAHFHQVDVRATVRRGSRVAQTLPRSASNLPPASARLGFPSAEGHAVRVRKASRCWRVMMRRLG